MVEDVRELFNLNKGVNNFTRIDNNHPINIFIGKDTKARYTLFIVSPYEINTLKSSALIDVHIGLRNDNMWGLSFILKNDDYADIFYHFCCDIIESSRNVLDYDTGINFICERYAIWQKMFEKNNSYILSKNQIKGIIGELMFLKEVLIPKYDEQVAIKSWLGPEMLPKDFICVDKWYEIKTVSSSVNQVTISSIEQLDSDIEGELVLIELDETSETDVNKISINNYFDKIVDTLSSYEDVLVFKNKLLNLGYYNRKEYDEYCFKFNKYKKYNVDSSFPCLRKDNLPTSIISAKYELSIASIFSFLVEEDVGWK